MFLSLSPSLKIIKLLLYYYFILLLSFFLSYFIRHVTSTLIKCYHILWHLYIVLVCLSVQKNTWITSRIALAFNTTLEWYASNGERIIFAYLAYATSNWLSYMPRDLRDLRWLMKLMNIVQDFLSDNMSLKWYMTLEYPKQLNSKFLREFQHLPRC